MDESLGLDWNKSSYNPDFDSLIFVSAQESDLCLDPLSVYKALILSQGFNSGVIFLQVLDIIVLRVKSLKIMINNFFIKWIMTKASLLQVINSNYLIS